MINILHMGFSMPLLHIHSVLTLHPISTLSKLSFLLLTSTSSLINDINRLSIIISQILKNVYGIRRPSGDQYVQIASMHLDLEAYTKDKNEAKQQESTQGAHDEAYLVHRTDADTTRNMDLKAWKERAGPLLDAASETLTELQNHQRVELLLAYHHAQMLLLRPFLLDYDIGDADVVSAEDRMVDSLVDACKAVCQLLEPRAGDNHTSYSAFVKSPAFQSAWVSPVFPLLIPISRLISPII